MGNKKQEASLTFEANKFFSSSESINEKLTAGLEYLYKYPLQIRSSDKNLPYPKIKKVQSENKGVYNEEFILITDHFCLYPRETTLRTENVNELDPYVIAREIVSICGEYSQQAQTIPDKQALPIIINPDNNNILLALTIIKLRDSKLVKNAPRTFSLSNLFDRFTNKK